MPHMRCSLLFALAALFGLACDSVGLHRVSDTCNCPTPEHAVSTCVDKVCAFTCVGEYRRVGDLCVATTSPDTVTSCGEAKVDCTVQPHVTATACIDGACVTTACAYGFILVGNSCMIDDWALCPRGTHPSGVDTCVEDTVACCGNACTDCASLPGVTNAACVNGTCVALSCAADFNLFAGLCMANTPQCCGIGCESCRGVLPHSQTVSCVSGVCTIETCVDGFHKSGNQCVYTQVGDCPLGEHLVDGVCVSNTSSDCCGTTCYDCAGLPNTLEAQCAYATCLATSCVPGYHPIAAQCVVDRPDACGQPAVDCLKALGTGVSTVQCQSGQCIPLSCATGFTLTRGRCLATSDTACGSSRDDCTQGLQPHEYGFCSSPHLVSTASCRVSCLPGYLMSSTGWCSEVSDLSTYQGDVCATLVSPNEIKCNWSSTSPSFYASLPALLPEGGGKQCTVSGGIVSCQGDNAYGELGVDPQTTPRLATFQPLPSQPWTATAVATGKNFSCALTDQGQVECWGSTMNLAIPCPAESYFDNNNGYGRCIYTDGGCAPGYRSTWSFGYGCVKSCSDPQTDDGTGTCASTCAQGYSGNNCRKTCPLSQHDDGKGNCVERYACAEGFESDWGDCRLSCPDGSQNNGLGVCAPWKTPDSRPEPIAIDLGGKRAVAIGASDDFAFAALEGGGIKCWGSRNGGICGGPASSYDPVSVPRNVPGLPSRDAKTLYFVRSSNSYSYYPPQTKVCVSIDDGYHCWGTDFSAKKVTAITTFDAIGFRSNGGCALVAGTIQCWDQDQNPASRKTLDIYGADNVQLLMYPTPYTRTRSGQIRNWGASPVAPPYAIDPAIATPRSRPAR